MALSIIEMSKVSFAISIGKNIKKFRFAFTQGIENDYIENISYIKVTSVFYGSVSFDSIMLSSQK